MEWRKLSEFKIKCFGNCLVKEGWLCRKIFYLSLRRLILLGRVLNLFPIFLFSSFFIDPTFFLGKWKLEKHGPINSFLQSEVLAELELDEQFGLRNAARLYLDNHYLEFRKDTVFWKDVESGEKGVVEKSGKWHLIGDTLIIMDYEKTVTSKYLITKDGEDGFSQRDIYPRGISKSPVIYSRTKEWAVDDDFF